MTHLDIFSGIGGFALAAQANGIKTVAFCEIDKNCQAFLSRAWPGIPIHKDIKELNGSDYYGTFLLTGGVPCQPASRAGKQLGKADDRWLWDQALRILAESRPAWCIFENPVGIRDVGLGGILTEMETIGYDFPRDIEGKPIVFNIPACAVGAPHRRERLWIVGNRKEYEGCVLHEREASRPSDTDAGRPIVKTDQWSDFVWLPCADGKLRRAPDDTQRMAHGIPMELLEALAEEEGLTPEILWEQAERFGDVRITGATPHRSLIGALGNSIVWQGAAEIIRAIVSAENETL